MSDLEWVIVWYLFPSSGGGGCDRVNGSYRQGRKEGRKVCANTHTHTHTHIHTHKHVISCNGSDHLYAQKQKIIITHIVQYDVAIPMKCMQIGYLHGVLYAYINYLLVHIMASRIKLIFNYYCFDVHSAQTDYQTHMRCHATVVTTCMHAHPAQKQKYYYNHTYKFDPDVLSWPQQNMTLIFSMYHNS